MSRSLRSDLKTSVMPGDRRIDTISTSETAGNAVKLLEIISESSSGARIQRDFAIRVCVGSLLKVFGMVHHEEKSYPLQLDFGEEMGLILKNGKGKSRSMKPKNGDLILEIGCDLNLVQLRGLANQLIATWVVHGFGWKNRSNSELTHRQPYGADAVAKRRSRSGGYHRSRWRRRDHYTFALE